MSMWCNKELIIFALDIHGLLLESLCKYHCIGLMGHDTMRSIWREHKVIISRSKESNCSGSAEGLSCHFKSHDECRRVFFYMCCSVVHHKCCKPFVTILCLTSRTTLTSARITEEDACHRVRNLCVFSHVQKGTPGLTHTGCVLQRLSLGALSDVTVVLWMRQSIRKVEWMFSVIR